MLLPIGDQPNDSKRVPWMNYALIAANVAVFLLVRSTARTEEAFTDLLFKWGYVPSDGKPITVVSCMFLHAGWMHLFGNMLFLWIFGDNIEARLGPLGYLLAYLGVGVAATLAFSAFNSDSRIPVVGASGAISGVQGMYFIACPKHRVKVFLWLYFYVTIIYVSARLIMGFWFFVNDVLPILINQGPTPGGVAHMAHIGGFVAGLGLMLVLRPLVKRIELAAAAELPRSGRYQSGHARRYGPPRRSRDSYRPRE